MDPLLASGMSADPQSFNRYAYVTNNPLTATDPTGRFSDRDWYTVSPDDMFQGYDDGLSIRRPIRYEEVIKRTTTTYTTVHVQEKGGSTVVSEARVIITETLVEYINESGDVLQRGQTQTSASAFDVNNRPKLYTDLQRRTMETVAVAIVEISREKQFEAAIALGIAAFETHLGTLANVQGVSWKESSINPMQLSGYAAKPTKGMAPADALRFTIRGSIDLFRSKRGSTLNAQLQAYGPPKEKVAYANGAEAVINRIRASLNKTVVDEPVFNPFPSIYRAPPRRP